MASLLGQGKTVAVNKRSELSHQRIVWFARHVSSRFGYVYRSLAMRRAMLLKKGQRVEELTKKTGQRPRVGVIIDLRDDTVEVRWDDGHLSSLTGALLRRVPDEEPPRSTPK